MLQRVHEFRLTPIAQIGLALYELSLCEVQGNQVVYFTLESKPYLLDWFVVPVKSPGRNILDYANYTFVETQLSKIAASSAVSMECDGVENTSIWYSVHYNSDYWSPCNFILVKPDTPAHTFAVHLDHRLSLHPVLDREMYESELKFAAIRFLDALDYEVLCALYKRIGLSPPSLSAWDSNNWNASDKIIDYVKRMFS